MARIHRRTIQKNLHNPDSHDGVITHLESDIMECKVKWALGSITTNKVSEGYRIPVELFQTLKDDAVKVLHSICQQIRKSAVATRLEMINFIKSQRKAMPKNILTASQLHSSHRLAK